VKSTTDIQDYPPHVGAPDIQASDIPNNAPPIKPADNPGCSPSIASSEVKPTDTPGHAPPVEAVDIQDHAPPIKETEHTGSPLYVVEWSRVRNKPPRRWLSVKRLKSVVYPGVDPLGYVGLAVLAVVLILGPVCLVNLSIADLEIRAPAEAIEQPAQKGGGMELDVLEKHFLK
jgi:hypothetical protein